MKPPRIHLPSSAWAVLWLVLAPGLAAAAGGLDQQVETLIEQNRRLLEQVQAQQQQIDELRARVTQVDRADEQRDQKINDLRAGASGATSDSPAPVLRSDRSEVRISGLTSFTFAKSGGLGVAPNSGFRVDEARLYFETPVAKDTYLFGGMDLVTREDTAPAFELGEFYLDFENVSGRAGGPDRLVNVRAGHLDIPFGEEYIVRDPLDNPLVTHSVGDFWGRDYGVEIYGASELVRYVVAVQNGGDQLNDFNSDKAVTARLSLSPAPWARVSASAMRTGALDAGNDFLSGLWMGNGFFRSIGAPATTTTFGAELGELDAAAFWTGGSLKAAFGGARYQDNDTSADNTRHLTYEYLEAVQSLTPEFYGAVRVSELRAPGGYPLVGLGDFKTYFLTGPPTTRLRRLSLGLGYRFNASLIWKLEYAIEDGELATGAPRDHENLLITEIAAKF